MERLRCRAGPLGLALALAVVGQLLSGASGQGLFFLVRPETAYAPLGTSASFTCSGTSSTSFSIFWRRNGIQFSTIELVSDGISYENSNVGSVVSSELTVPTSVENNGTSFTCLLSIPTVVSNLSNPVQLIILDVPSPPFDLSLRSLSDTQLNLSWSSPPSFPGVPLSFTVTVTRTRDSLLIDTVPGITDTQFLFNRPSVSSDCEEYQFSVSAINAAGTSDPRQQSGGFPEDPSQAQITNAIVDVSSNPAITVSFQPLADSCRFSPITSYTASIFTTAEVLRLSSASVSPDMREIVVNATSIELNAEFLVRVTANTEFGSSLSDSRTIYTSDVQSVSIMPLPGDTHNCVISCYFAVGTLARGCQIELLDSSDIIRLDLPIHRAIGSLVANTTFGVNLDPGVYTVRAYDLEQDMSTTRSVFVVTSLTLNNSGSIVRVSLVAPLRRSVFEGVADGAVEVCLNVTGRFSGGRNLSVIIVGLPNQVAPSVEVRADIGRSGVQCHTIAGVVIRDGLLRDAGQASVFLLSTSRAVVISPSAFIVFSVIDEDLALLNFTRPFFEVSESEGLDGVCVRLELPRGGAMSQPVTFRTLVRQLSDKRGRDFSRRFFMPLIGYFHIGARTGDVWCLPASLSGDEGAEPSRRLQVELFASNVNVVPVKRRVNLTIIRDSTPSP